MIIQEEVNARAGVLGNPSDMYSGRVISFVIRNFAARVRLWESPNLTLKLHPQHDRTEFQDIRDLANSVQRHGYYGMQRLLLATCRRFADFCKERKIKINRSGFTLEYDTDIPRQSGLGGSSAMIIATLRALFKFYRLPTFHVSESEFAHLALSVETNELGIAAGLQDRIVQVFGGLTYMDFSMPEGKYERLDSRLLPKFGLAYPPVEKFKARESGQVHSQVRLRWEQGDLEVKRTMCDIAECAKIGFDAMQKKDYTTLGCLMNRNFDLRRALFGDKALGEHSIKLVEIARNAGFPAKLPGSGNAVLILLNKPKAAETLARDYAESGYNYLSIHTR